MIIVLYNKLYLLIIIINNIFKIERTVRTNSWENNRCVCVGIVMDDGCAIVMDDYWTESARVFDVREFIELDFFFYKFYYTYLYFILLFFLRLWFGWGSFVFVVTTLLTATWIFLLKSCCNVAGKYISSTAFSKIPYPPFHFWVFTLFVFFYWYKF